MRLSEDRIREGILHPDEIVREFAVDYFAEGHSTAADVMPLIIRAVELYGPKACTRLVSAAEKLVQSPETIDWLVSQFGLSGLTDIERIYYFSAIERVLVQQDPELIAPHWETLQKLDVLDPLNLGAIQRQQALLGVEYEKLWHLVGEKAEALANDSAEDFEWQSLLEISAALARRDGKRAVEDSLGELERIGEGSDDKDAWIELAMIAILGRLRASEAIPNLVARLDVDEDLTREECITALVRIGSDEVVEQVGEAYRNGDSSRRLSAADVLGKIRSDRAVELALQFLETEEDLELKTFLAIGLMEQACVDAIEPVRRMELEQDYDPQTADLRESLVPVAMLAEVDFPELEDWREEIRSERARFENDDWFGDEDDEDDGIPFSYEPDVADSPQLTSAKTVGRNDPCPCGSGKKYKKCCLGIEDAVRPFDA